MALAAPNAPRWRRDGDQRRATSTAPKHATPNPKLLAQTGAPVTAAERGELVALAEAAGEGSEYIPKLTVTG